MSKPLRILVACEFSGTVRDAFREQGHIAWSCDLLPSETPGNHLQCDVREVLNQGWDMMIAHPPCVDLAVSGARHFAAKRADGRQQASIEFFLLLANAPIPRICIENPIGIMSTLYRKPDQILQPWMFGSPEQKATCLWLKNLPPLQETNNVRAEMMLLPKSQRERIHYMPPSADRWKLRSLTYPGIAQAMANQWSTLP